MNSVDKHLDASSKAATLLAMRSARKEILLVVEGDTDVDIFSNALGVPRSNILSCGGKEILMRVYGMAPQKGIDSGTVFIRDRDNDHVTTGVSNMVLILVTDLYDLEMDLLNYRLFGRILSEFLKTSLEPVRITAEFDKLCLAASYIGAIRIHSQINNIGLDFDDLKYTRFFKPQDLSVNLPEALRYIFAKSNKALADKNLPAQEIQNLMRQRSPVDVVCSKDFLDILQLALHRYYSVCPAGECSAITLSRMIRISTVHDDLRGLAFYQPLKAHVAGSEYSWMGQSL